MRFLPQPISKAYRFAAHRELCPTCKTFDGQLRNLNVVCTSGLHLLKDDWQEIEAADDRARARDRAHA